MSAIGILAGSGQFPFLVARNAKKAGHTVVVCGFENNADPALEHECDIFTLLPLGQLGALIAFFKKNKVTQLCMAGAISKPKALDFKPDMRAAKLLFKLAGSRGDDAILRMLADELLSEGITVLEPDVLVPDLTDVPEGLLAGPDPAPEVWEDIAFGWKMAKAVGALDIGQCVAVKKRIVVAVESIEGTDAMLERAGVLSSGGCTMVKVLKPGQDTRIDKPSIGPKTIEIMGKYHFSALVFEAGKTLFFEQKSSLESAEALGISVIAVPEDAELFFATKI